MFPYFFSILLNPKNTKYHKNDVLWELKVYHTSYKVDFLTNLLTRIMNAIKYEVSFSNYCETQSNFWYHIQKQCFIQKNITLLFNQIHIAKLFMIGFGVCCLIKSYEYEINLSTYLCLRTRRLHSAEQVITKRSTFFCRTQNILYF